MKSGKVSFETDAKDRKRIDVSELTRVYGALKTERAEPVNDTPKNNQMKGTDTPTGRFMTENDTARVIALLEGQVQDLKAHLAQANTEKAELLTLANNLQKQNEVLMLPPPREKHRWGQRLKNAFTRPGKGAPEAQ